MNDTDPDQICGAIAMCPARRSHSAVSDSSQKCVLCEFAITSLDSMIEDKGNQEKVRL